MVPPLDATLPFGKVFSDHMLLVCSCVYISLLDLYLSSPRRASVLLQRQPR